jgi:O-antigen ligase
MISRVFGRLLACREGLITVGVSGAGVVLALSLASPVVQPLAVAVSGVVVYFLVILGDPLKGLLLWLVTQILLDRHLNISLGAGIPDLSLTRLCIALITVLLLARAAIRRHRLQSVNKFDVLAFLLIVGTMQSGLRGIYGVRSIQGVFDLYWVPILTYFAVKNLVTSRQSVHLVLYAVLFIALYSAVYAIYESTTGNVLSIATVTGPTIYSESGLRILRGIWGGNESFGRVLVMGIPIGFYFYLKTSSPARRAGWAICLALVFVGLFFTYKRAAWLAMVATVFVMQSFYPQFRRLFIVLLIVVIIAVNFNWDRISTSTVYTARIHSQSSTKEGRTDGWKHALEFWSANPLLGYGFRQYRNLARAAGYRDKAVESEYLDILVSSGLVGFLPYVGLLLLMAYDGLQHYRGRVADGLADQDLVAVFWGILVGYAITISTAIVTCLVIPSMLFAVAGAIIYARRSSPSRLSEMELERSRMHRRWRSNGGLQKY